MITSTNGEKIMFIRTALVVSIVGVLTGCAGEENVSVSAAPDVEGIWNIQTTNVTDGVTSVGQTSVSGTITIGPWTDGTEYISVYVYDPTELCVQSVDVETADNYTIGVNTDTTYSFDRVGDELQLIEYSVNGTTSTFYLELREPYSIEAEEVIIHNGIATGFC